MSAAVDMKLRELPGLQAILPRSPVGTKVKGGSCTIVTEMEIFSAMGKFLLCALKTPCFARGRKRKHEHFRASFV